ncbi:MAG: 1-deoxy-D-xylulose-5-phosphate reductoisomerase, partial [Candidatus Omnitrophota bacterium]
GQLNFSKPDLKKFPALSLCIHVAKKGGTLPSVLNAADEEAVEAYLNGDIKFTRIYDVVEKIVMKHKTQLKPSLKQILQADQWAREETRKVLGYSC